MTLAGRPAALRLGWVLALSLLAAADDAAAVDNAVADDNAAVEALETSDAGYGQGYGADLIRNVLLPGSALFAAGRPAEGALMALGAPLVVAGQLLFWNSALADANPASIEALSAPLASDHELGVWAGRSMYLLGLGLLSSGQWSAHRLALGGTHSGMFDLAIAPFDAKVLGDSRVWAPLAAAVGLRAALLPADTWKEFFAADRRYFLGYYWQNWGALAAKAGTAAVAAFGSALAGEALLRGLAQESYGFVTAFGADAAGLAAPYLVLGSSLDTAGYADAFAQLMAAAYAGNLARSTGSPRASLALRFWLTAALSTLDYVERVVADPLAPTEGFGFGVKLRF
jgi:hypothetical protein